MILKCETQYAELDDFSLGFTERDYFSLGFRGDVSDKGPAADAGDVRDKSPITGSKRSPRGGHGNPFLYSCLENTPWTEEPGRLHLMWSQRVEHD